MFSGKEQRGAAVLFLEEEMRDTRVVKAEGEDWGGEVQRGKKGMGEKEGGSAKTNHVLKCLPNPIILYIN